MNLKGLTLSLEYFVNSCLTVKYLDIAWKIISEIASEVLKTMQAEEQSEDREEDDVVKVILLSLNLLY